MRFSKKVWICTIWILIVFMLFNALVIHIVFGRSHGLFGVIPTAVSGIVILFIICDFIGFIVDTLYRRVAFNIRNGLANKVSLEIESTLFQLSDLTGDVEKEKQQYLQCLSSVLCFLERPSK